MSRKTTILAVDSDNEVLRLYRQHAQDQGYQTVVANDAETALTILQQVSVELIISDVHFPGLDGHEFCRQVKAIDKTRNIPFIFVSTVTELDELVKGYSLGAIDYIPKPIIYDELILKVKSLVKTFQHNGQAVEQLEAHHKVAMEAMSYSSELGQVLEFYKACEASKALDDLANFLFVTTSTLGLSCSLQIYSDNNQSIGYSHSGSLSPIESEIMLAARNQPRFFDFGKRTILNYKRFSLLIKNMPIDNPEKYGRIKDILGSLADALESRMDVLLFRSSVKQKQNVVDMVGNTMMDIDSSLMNLQKENVAALDDMIENLEEALLILGLTEHQENSIMDISRTCLSRINNAFYVGVGISEKLEALRLQLAKTVD